MRTSRVVLAVALVAAVVVGPSFAAAAPSSIGGAVPSGSLARAVRRTPPAPPTPATPPTPALSTTMRDLLDRVNAERSLRGLAPMSYDDRLVLAAQQHSDDQAGMGRMTHTGSDGSTVAVRVDRVGYGWRSLAENVAFGYTDVSAVMAGWMASDGHRRNILSSNTHLGLGVAAGADGRLYWTQVFATPT